MATRAYILIETAVGHTREVAAAMRQLKGMVTVDALTGPYDIIALFEGPDLTSVGEMVTAHVHALGGITRTTTCLAIDLG